MIKHIIINVDYIPSFHDVHLKHSIQECVGIPVDNEYSVLLYVPVTLYLYWGIDIPKASRLLYHFRYNYQSIPTNKGTFWGKGAPTKGKLNLRWKYTFFRHHDFNICLSLSIWSKTLVKHYTLRLGWLNIHLRAREASEQGLERFSRGVGAPTKKGNLCFK